MKKKRSYSVTPVSSPESGLTPRMISHQRMLADLQGAEKAYPIYFVDVLWSEDYPPGSETQMNRIGMPLLPEGRFWNSTGWDTMFREVRDLEDIEAEALRDWWPKYREKLLNPGDPIIVARFLRWEVWTLTWFSHWSFDVGMTNDEVLASFSRYVDRTEDANRREGAWKGDFWVDRYSLMSAEDRWRWSGKHTEGGAQTPPPCRCEDCKKQGVVRIDH